MFLRTCRAKRTKAVFIVWAERNLGVGVDVEVEAFFAVTAIAITDKKVTLGHFAAIVREK